MRRSTAPVSATLSDLSWLSGCWRGKYESDWGEEFWSEQHHDALVGVSRCYSGDSLRYTDLTWILETADGIQSKFLRFGKNLLPLDHLHEPANFELVDIAENYATFYSTEIEGGAWMKYERIGDSLIGRFCIGAIEEDIIHYTLDRYPMS